MRVSRRRQLRVQVRVSNKILLSVLGGGIWVGRGGRSVVGIIVVLLFSSEWRGDGSRVDKLYLSAGDRVVDDGGVVSGPAFGAESKEGGKAGALWAHWRSEGAMGGGGGLADVGYEEGREGAGRGGVCACPWRVAASEGVKLWLAQCMAVGPRWGVRFLVWSESEPSGQQTREHAALEDHRSEGRNVRSWARKGHALTVSHGGQRYFCRRVLPF